MSWIIVNGNIKVLTCNLLWNQSVRQSCKLSFKDKRHMNSLAFGLLCSTTCQAVRMTAQSETHWQLKKLAPIQPENLQPPHGVYDCWSERTCPQNDLEPFICETYSVNGRSPAAVRRIECFLTFNSRNLPVKWDCMYAVHQNTHKQMLKMTFNHVYFISSVWSVARWTQSDKSCRDRPCLALVLFVEPFMTQVLCRALGDSQ